MLQPSGPNCPVASCPEPRNQAKIEANLNAWRKTRNITRPLRQINITEFDSPAYLAMEGWRRGFNSNTSPVRAAAMITSSGPPPPATAHTIFSTRNVSTTNISTSSLPSLILIISPLLFRPTRRHRPIIQPSNRQRPWCHMKSSSSARDELTKPYGLLIETVPFITPSIMLLVPLPARARASRPRRPRRCYLKYLYIPRC